MASRIRAIQPPARWTRRSSCSGGPGGAPRRTRRARWNEWLAADGPERPELYRCYLAALAEEERAAVAIERTVSLETNAQDARDTMR